MSKLMQRLFPAGICGLAFLSAGVRSGQAQGVYELRCRGGPEAFSIDRLNETTLSLNFSAIERPAGPLAEGLDSGTCSWIDRALREGEPRQIQFGVSASQATSIPQHLNHANNYWSFFVSNSNYKGKASYASVAELATSTLGNDRDGLRREFVNLVRKAEALAQRQRADRGSIEVGR